MEKNSGEKLFCLVAANFHLGNNARIAPLRRQIAASRIPSNSLKITYLRFNFFGKLRLHRAKSMK
jgi:hypothetical protein